jgi:hypothetical protein
MRLQKIKARKENRNQNDRKANQQSELMNGLHGVLIVLQHNQMTIGQCGYWNCARSLQEPAGARRNTTVSPPSGRPQGGSA